MRIIAWLVLLGAAFAMMAYVGILEIAECTGMKHIVSCLIDR